MLLLSAKCPRPSGRRENALCKTIWRTIQRANNTFWSNGWRSSVFTERSGENSSIWQERITRNHSGLWADRGGQFGKEIFRWQIWKIWKRWTHQPRRIVLIRRKDDKFIFPIADGTAKWSGRDHEFRVPTLKREQTCKEWRYQWRNSGRMGRVWTGRTNRWRWSRCRIFGRLEVTSSIVITMNLEFNSTCRRKTRSLFHSNTLNVSRSTHPDEYVLQEKKIGDCWISISNEHLSDDSWRGFTKFTLLKEKPPKGYVWSGRRLTKIQTTSRPDYVWPKVWTKIGKAAQNREKQEWAKEKPKIDNAR